jgi:hypothetical protein
MSDAGMLTRDTARWEWPLEGLRTLELRAVIAGPSDQDHGHVGAQAPISDLRGALEAEIEGIFSDIRKAPLRGPALKNGTTASQES